MNNKFNKKINECIDIIYSNLNDMQKEAVKTVTGPLLVIAGAGSGKTTVLVNRISNIIKFGQMTEFENIPFEPNDDDIKILEEAKNEDKSTLMDTLANYSVNPCPPWAVMCITFTNKAANEMKTRLENILGPELSNDIWAGTFHNICMRILRKFSNEAGLAPGFTIYDTDDSKRLIKNICTDLKIDEHIVSPKAIQYAISKAKEELISPYEYSVQAGRDIKLSKISQVYSEYDRQLSQANAVDFDDIIFKTVNLLRNCDDAREYVQNRFRYICVDEYQDTNKAQFVLTTLFAGDRKNIMVVGDDDQSIYRFRGATIENILNFDKVYPDAKVIKLEQNYRSTSNILNSANGIIKNNKERRDKTLWTAAESGDPVQIKELANQNLEARYIVDTINDEVEKNGRSYSDFAILYRVNAQSQSLENVLARSGMNYKIVGGTRFYDRKEIKDILAYLCLIANTEDNLRLKRIINEPKRKIGQTTMDAVEGIANAEGISMFDVIQNSNQYIALSRSSTNLRAFASLINTFRASVTEGISVAELIKDVIEKSGYKAMLQAQGPSEEDRIENIEELISNALEYEDTTEDATLYGFLEDVALISDLDNYDENQEAITLMTIHSAKGLEFPYVFLPGWEEGIFPSYQSLSFESELEEERRLAYVAITRAKQKIFITYVRERLLYGRTEYNRPSRFISEIPDDYCEKHIREVAKPTITNNALFSSSFAKQKTKEFGKPKEYVKKDSSFIRFNAGDEVIHKTFGHGVVLSVTDMGADVLYEIMFDTQGTKKLMATYAKLTKA